MCNKPASWRSFKLDDLFDLPETRAEAIKNENEYYFTKKFCSAGHLHIRNTKTRRCVLCSARDNGSPGQPAYWTEESKTLVVFGMKVKLTNDCDD